MSNSVPLVSTEWLNQQLGDPSLAVLEVSADPLGESAYRQGHIPGSRFVYWKDFLWHESDRQLASPEEVAVRLGTLGVPAEGTIALVGDPVHFATYAFWVLTQAGQASRVVHVDGGREKWVAEGRLLTTDTVEPTPSHVEPSRAEESSRIGRDELREGLSDPRRLVIDVRSPEEYAGERVSPPFFEFDHGAERKGHIPGAHHVYYQDLLTDQGALLSPDQIRRRFGDLPIDSSEVVVYCRLSHRATMVWFALKHLLGVPNVRVYDGSWTEWGSIVGFPIERSTG